MYPVYALSLLLLGGTAMAIDPPHPLIPRQTSDAWDPLDTSGAECLSGLFDAVRGAPMPPSEIRDVMTDFFMTVTGSVDYQCGWQTALPSSLVDDWYEYQDKVIDWLDDNKDKMASALDNCPEGYESSAGPCTSTLPGHPRPTGASGGGGGGGGSSNGGAPVEKGYLAASIAAFAVALGLAVAL